MPQTRCDSLIEARWIVPVTPADVCLENHAVAVTNGRIVGIEPAETARRAYRSDVTISRPDHVLLPGFVNAHTHAAMTLFRGYADDMALEPWLRERIWPAEQRWVGAEMVRDGTRHAIAEMLKSGVTCFSDQYFFPEIVAEVADEMHIRADVATPVIDFRTAWADDGAHCLKKAADLVHDAYVDHPRITTCFAPHSTDVVSDDTFHALRILADQLDRRVQIHLHESAAEVEKAVSDTGERPIARMERLGFMNGSLLAVHAVHLLDEEIDRMAEAGVSVAHCPRSNLKLASGMARVRDMRAAGVNVALGTDGAASNNELDILGELRLAALLAKGVAGDPTALRAHDALRMASLDGAKALGLHDEIGSIEPGKAADLVCLDISHVQSQPLYDAASQVVYTCGASQVADVWVAGRQLIDAGQLGVADEREIIARSQEWQRRISSP